METALLTGRRRWRALGRFRCLCSVIFGKLRPRSEHFSRNLRAALRVFRQARCVCGMAMAPARCYITLRHRYMTKNNSYKYFSTQNWIIYHVKCNERPVLDPWSKRKCRLKHSQLSSRQKDDSSNFPLPTTLCEARGWARSGHMAGGVVREGVAGGGRGAGRLSRAAPPQWRPAVATTRVSPPTLPPRAPNPLI